jgi:hypothetical protein
VTTPTGDEAAAAAAKSEILAVLDAYAATWSDADFGQAATLWDSDDDAPVYLGIEYSGPLIGWSELNRHWGRLGARVRAATLSWADVHINLLSHDLATVVMLSAWEIEGVEEFTPRSGHTWVTALLRRRAHGWRLAQYVETPAYLPEAAA